MQQGPGYRPGPLFSGSMPAVDSEEAAPSKPDPAASRSQIASPHLLEGDDGGGAGDGGDGDGGDDNGGDGSG